MRIPALFFLAVVGTALAGCGGITQLVRDEQSIPIAKDVNPMQKLEDLGSIYAWPPHASAMVIDGEGNRCVRVAAGARVTGGTSDIGAEIETVKKLGEGIKGGVRDEVEQAFIRLNSPSQLANILDVVLFHHCIQDMNGTFTIKAEKGDVKLQEWKAQETMKLYQNAIEVIKTAYPKEQQSPSTPDSVDAGSSGGSRNSSGGTSGGGSNNQGASATSGTGGTGGTGGSAGK